MKPLCALLLFTAGVFAQDVPTLLKPETQPIAFNSSFKLSKDQIQLGQLWSELVEDVETVLNFDRSQLAHGGPRQDSFYTLGHVATPHSPGEVLKVQHVTDPAQWNIPAKTSLSRYIYTTTDANGTLIPASAYVLWPWIPKEVTSNSKGKAPVVLWSHGTAGYFADGAPSAHRSLFYGNIMPFALAQAGYAVVATDYAGLGVETSWDGTYVPHQYQNRVAQAYDSLHALQAARKIFPGKITNTYVNVGHSQGGAAAWGVSEVLAENPSNRFEDLEHDYLGSVIFAPGLNSLLAQPQAFASWIGKDLHLMYPDFQLSDWLSPLGIARTELLTQLQGGQYVSELLFLANVTEMLNPAWHDSWYADAFQNFTNPGDRRYKSPMVLFQGTADQGGLLYNDSMPVFDSTCKHHYSGPFEYITLQGVQHFPSMDSTRHLWLQWIEDRFKDVPVGLQRCSKTTLQGFFPDHVYQNISTSFSQWAGEPHEYFELVAGGF